MRIVTMLALGIALASQAPLGLTGEAAPVPILILDFDYVDTSGEPRDQSAFHRAQLDNLVHSLRGDLERTSKFRVVSMQCEPAQCSPGESEPTELVAAACCGGARLLLFGCFFLVCSLVLWASVQIV